MEEFQQLIAKVKENFRLEWNPAKQGAEDLIFYMTLSFQWETQCLVRVLGQMMPDLPPEESLKKVKEVSDN